MRAMTEIPANTPRPIGSTDNFFPGRANAAVVVPEASAAAADADCSADEITDAAAAPDGLAVDAPVVGAPVDTGAPVTVDTGCENYA